MLSESLYKLSDRANNCVMVNQMKKTTKKEWEKAEVEKIEFDATDIIVSSGIIDFPDVPTP